MKRVPEFGRAPSISPSELLDKVGEKRVGYVKMDVEGAEEELLLNADVSWLGRVDAISVELHRGAPTEAIAAVLRRAGFSVTRSSRHRSALEGYTY